MTIEEEFKESIDVWMRENLEELRYNYSLNRNSIVFDVGFYKGEFTGRIFRSYNCNILSFEPVFNFFVEGCRNIPKNNKIRLFNYGIGNKDTWEWISIDGDKSSIHTKSDSIKKKAVMKSFFTVIKEENITFIDLIKINIEGGEYDLLEYMLDNNYISICNNIQVQFHTFVENAKERRNKIRERLAITHKETYNFPWVWESWNIK